MNGSFAHERLIAEHLRLAADAASNCTDEAIVAKNYYLRRHFGLLASELYLIADATDPDTFDLGAEVPSWLSKKGPVWHVSGDMEEEEWRVVRVLGEVMKRDSMFDRNPFQESDDLQAHLWIAEDRAAGVLAYAQEEERFRWLDDVERERGDAPIHGESVATLRIVGVWVARQHRNRGIAKRLAAAAGEAFGLDPQRFIHSPPFSRSGRSFAESLSGGRVRVPVDSDPWS